MGKGDFKLGWREGREGKVKGKGGGLGSTS